MLDWRGRPIPRRRRLPRRLEDFLRESRVQRTPPGERAGSGGGGLQYERDRPLGRAGATNKRRRNELPLELDALVVAAYQADPTITAVAVAEQFGISEWSVRRRLRGAGIDPSARHRRGVPKLSPEDYTAVEAWYNAGEPIKDIAAAVGLTHQAISEMALRHGWPPHPHSNRKHRQKQRRKPAGSPDANRDGKGDGGQFTEAARAVTAALLEYDPDQPRGRDGRWIEIHGPQPRTNPALWQPWEAAVAVDEKHRRKGVARTLMQAAMQDGLDVLSSEHERYTPEGLALSSSLGRDVPADATPADRPPGFYELLFHMRAVDKKGPPGVSRETYYEHGDERLQRSDWHAYVYRDENGDPIGALEVYAPYLREALREAWDESKVFRARTTPGTNSGSFASYDGALAAAAKDFARSIASTPEQRAAERAARVAGRDAFEAAVQAAGYKRRDRVRLKDRPGDFELFDYRYLDGKGIVTVAPETAWGSGFDPIDTTLDNLAGHATSPNPAHLRNPFTRVHPQYKGPLIAEGYHNGSYAGIAGVRKEGFDFSKHQRGTWGVGAYLFTGWGGKGFNPGGPGEDSVPLRANVTNALVVKLDDYGALDRMDPGQAEFDRITRDVRTIHEKRAAMLAAGYDGLLVLKWGDEPYLMVAYDPQNTVTILGEKDVSSVSGIIAVGDEAPRGGDYDYRAGSDTLRARGLIEADAVVPLQASEPEWPDDIPFSASAQPARTPFEWALAIAEAQLCSAPVGDQLRKAALTALTVLASASPAHAALREDEAFEKLHPREPAGSATGGRFAVKDEDGKKRQTNARYTRTSTSKRPRRPSLRNIKGREMEWAQRIAVAERQRDRNTLEAFARLTGIRKKAGRVRWAAATVAPKLASLGVEAENLENLNVQEALLALALVPSSVLAQLEARGTRIAVGTRSLTTYPEMAPYLGQPTHDGRAWDEAPGVFDPVSNTVIVNASAGEPQLMLHEVAHAFDMTVAHVSDDPTLDRLWNTYGPSQGSYLYDPALPMESRREFVAEMLAQTWMRRWDITPKAVADYFTARGWSPQRPKPKPKRRARAKR